MLAIPIEAKSVILAVALVAVLSAAGGGGSAAFFADSQVSQDNTITADDFGPIELDAQFQPRTVKVGSSKSAQVKVAQPDDGRQIDPETVVVRINSTAVDNDPRTTNPQWSIHDVDRDDVVDAVDGDPGEYVVTVTGEFGNNGSFEATTDVTITKDSEDTRQTTSSANTSSTTENNTSSTTENSTATAEGKAQYMPQDGHSSMRAKVSDLV